jgi:hypothetical protein
MSRAPPAHVNVLEAALINLGLTGITTAEFLGAIENTPFFFLDPSGQSPA